MLGCALVSIPVNVRFCCEAVAIYLAMTAGLVLFCIHWLQLVFSKAVDCSFASQHSARQNMPSLFGDHNQSAPERPSVFYK